MTLMASSTPPWLDRLASSIRAVELRERADDELHDRIYAAARGSVPDSVPVAVAAATRIQRIWRGFSARGSISRLACINHIFDRMEPCPIRRSVFLNYILKM
jgi:hypothetical protein